MTASGSAPGKERPDARDGSDALHFGECAGCFGSLERPFWDRLCFACEDEYRDNGDAVLGLCPHGVDLDREFCSRGCRV